MQLLHRLPFLALNKTKPRLKWTASKGPWHGVCKWANASSMAETPQAERAESPAAAQAPSCLPALQWWRGEQVTGLKDCHATDSRAYMRPPHRVEETLCSSGQWWRWCIPPTKGSRSCCVRGGWHALHTKQQWEKLIKLSLA